MKLKPLQTMLICGKRFLCLLEELVNTGKPRTRLKLSVHLLDSPPSTPNSVDEGILPAGLCFQQPGESGVSKYPVTASDWMQFVLSC